MIIRWLGAFAKNGTLQESLQYEINRQQNEEVAAELIKKGVSEIDHAKVGLLVSNKALIKKFNGDCFSVSEDGKLIKTRNPKHAGSSHLEAWVNPRYKAIVIKSLINEKTFEVIKNIAISNGLPVMILKAGKLKEIK